MYIYGSVSITQTFQEGMRYICYSIMSLYRCSPDMQIIGKARDSATCIKARTDAISQLGRA